MTLNEQYLDLRRREKGIGNRPYIYKKEKKEFPWPVVFIGLSMVLLFAAVAFADTPKHEKLKASWYSIESLVKEGTYKTSKGVMANGQKFDDTKFTCATRLYPLRTWLNIINRHNGRMVRVRVTDRIGKRFAKRRIDLSKAAFSQIADLNKGIIKIKVKVIDG